MADNAAEMKKPLPLTPEEVTTEWLSSALGHPLKSSEYTAQTLLATASKLFVTVEYDGPPGAPQDEGEIDTRPTHLCIKGGFNPAVVARYPDIVVKMYQREAEFFNRVAPTLAGVDLPRSHWAGTDDRNGIVIMDDLAKVGNNSFGDPTEPWPVERVLKGVEQLAGLHASTWGNSLAADYPWLRACNAEHYDQTIRTMITWWERLVVGESRPHFPGDWTEARVAAAMDRHLTTRDERFRCLVHGDPHAGNTFITPGDEPRFLDWQLIHVGSPFHDVAYFVVGALAVDDRRAREMDVLDHYLASLARFGGPALERREVLDEYRRNVISGVGWMMTPYELQSKERVTVMCERYGAAIVEHGTLELLEASSS